MTRRALIVAIETYDSGSLAGTERGATLFREWLIHTCGFSPADIVSCASPAFPGRTHGTTRDEIARAVRDLIARGRDATDELHVFLSGRGLGEADGLAPADALVASDERSISIGEIEARLLAALGPGRHHLWLDLDVARDVVAPEPIDGDVVLSRRGVPSLHTLVAATHAAWPRLVGAFARVRARRVDALGAVRAGIETHMYVTFDVLATLMRKHGDDDTLLLEVHPLATQGLGDTDAPVPERGYIDAGYELAIPPAGRTTRDGRPIVVATPLERATDGAPRSSAS